MPVSCLPWWMMNEWGTGNLNRRAASQGAQLNFTADTGHSGQESSMVLNQPQRINVVRKIFLLVQSAVSRAWQHQETRSSVATCTCAQWVWCVDRWSAVTVAFDTLQLCADVKCLHQAWSSVMVPRGGSGCLQFNCAYFTLELLQGFAPESLGWQCEGRIWPGHHSGVSSQLSEGCNALMGSGKHVSCCYSRCKGGRSRAVK